MKEYITKLINDWDPIELFPYSPKDEYKDEIEQIYLFAQSTNNIDYLAEYIQTVFIKEFGDKVFKRNYLECFSIAKTIFELK